MARQRLAPNHFPAGMSLPDSVGAQLGFAEHSPLPTVSNWCRLSPTSVDTAYHEVVWSMVQGGIRRLRR